MLQQLQKAWRGGLTYATAEVVASHMFTLMTCACTFWRILNARKERMWVPVLFFSLQEHMLNDLIDHLTLKTPCFKRWQCDWNSEWVILSWQLFRLQYLWAPIRLLVATLTSDSGQKISTTFLLMCLGLMDFSSSRWKCPSTTSFL